MQGDYRSRSVPQTHEQIIRGHPGPDRFINTWIMHALGVPIVSCNGCNRIALHRVAGRIHGPYRVTKVCKGVKHHQDAIGS